MYTENKKNNNLRDLIIKILLAILFIFLLIWLIPKLVTPVTNDTNTNKDNSEDLANINDKLDAITAKILEGDIYIMKDAAKAYFTNERLPKEVGAEVKLTLGEMLEKELLLPLVDKDGNACSSTQSYVTVTKLKTEYKLDVYLTCSGKTNHIVEYLGCTDYCSTFNKTINVFERKLYKGVKTVKSGTTLYEFVRVIPGEKPKTTTNYSYQGTKTTTSKVTEYQLVQQLTQSVYVSRVTKTIYTPYTIYELKKVTTSTKTTPVTQHQYKKTNSSSSEYCYETTAQSDLPNNSIYYDNKYTNTGKTTNKYNEDCDCDVTYTIYTVCTVTSVSNGESYVWTTKTSAPSGYTSTGKTRTAYNYTTKVTTETKYFKTKTNPSDSQWKWTGKTDTKTEASVEDKWIYTKDEKEYVKNGYEIIARGYKDVTIDGKTIWSTSSSKDGYKSTGKTRIVDGDSKTETSAVVSDKKVLYNLGYSDNQIKTFTNTVTIPGTPETYGEKAWFAATSKNGWKRTNTPPKKSSGSTKVYTSWVTESEWNSKYSKEYTLHDTKIQKVESTVDSIPGYTKVKSYAKDFTTCSPKK
ncbi:MAG: hypothetical protein ACK5HL_04560 [Bacilli bacterium]